MNKLMLICAISTLISINVSIAQDDNSANAFPAIMPTQKPENISAAMERLYDKWGLYEDRTNELFSNFKYTELEGLECGTGISRRDPTKVIKVEDLYYVYYTCRKTESDPQGYDKSSDVIPSFDWDLSDIYYATSKDGVEWREEGVAVARPPKPDYGWRSVTTPGILVWEGKYYIYFQAFNETPGGAGGDAADVRVAVSESPRGPFTISDSEIIPYGEAGTWDSKAIHDPCPIVHNGKINIFYKGHGSDKDKRDISLNIGGGVAYATDPLGPFEKSPLNPVLNSGHETCVFPFMEGIAAIISLNGPEKNTVQYAADGVNFEVASHIVMPPIAPGPYVADAFTNTDNGKGITWGLSHVSVGGIGSMASSMLLRFDCDLNQEIDNQSYKQHNLRFKSDVYLDEPLVKKTNTK